MASFITAKNWDGAATWAPSSGKYDDVTCPSNGAVIGKVALSTAADVDAAVARATVRHAAKARSLTQFFFA